MLAKIRTYRWITPAILALFAISAIGIDLDIHLCQGHISGIKLVTLSKNNSSKSCCLGKCSLNGGDAGCCDDVKVTDSMDYDAVAHSKVETDKKPDHKKAYYSSYNKGSIGVFKTDRLVLSYTGPPIRAIGRHILFQSFLC